MVSVKKTAREIIGEAVPNSLPLALPIHLKICLYTLYDNKFVSLYVLKRKHYENICRGIGNRDDNGDLILVPRGKFPY